MIPGRPSTALCLLALLLVGFPTARAAQAEPDPAEAAGPETVVDLPQGLQIDWQGTLKQTEDGAAEFTGPVTITWKDTRIQADRLSLRDERYIEAEGNVLMVWGGNRIFGSRMLYDLEEERGKILDAVGSALDQYMFTAREVEKIGDNKLHLVHATITTCTQPTPYWSFAISSATITIDNYARMWNVRLRVSKAPIIYLPYIIWPVKDGRAAGLLMPEFSNTSTRGRVITQELFIPLGRSADLMLLGRYYSEVGFGGGGAARFIPNLGGSASISGFYIEDNVGQFVGQGRYRADYRQTQQFRNGFRMLADVQIVSDDSYYVDFERDLNQASLPQTLTRLEFSRNGPWVSTNVREVRREQLSSGLVQQTLPEIEWRGRSRRLWKSPLYLSFESSIASIQQRRPQTVNDDSDYLRGDVAPVVTVAWSPARWIDITPRVSYRHTYYTQRQVEIETGEGDTERVVVDEGLTRQLWTYDVEIVGPKFFRIFERPKSGARYKHAIEPRITYGYGQTFDDRDEIIKYDQVDNVFGSGTRMTYSLVQRLFAKRSRAESIAPPETTEIIVLPDGTTDDGAPVPGPESVESPAAGPETDLPRPQEPVEIASLTLGQVRSFDEPLSFADFDGDGTIDRTSQASPIRITGRYSPGPGVSLDLRGNYDTLFKELADASLSGNMRNRWATVRFSMVYRNGLPDNQKDSFQTRLATGFSFIRNKLQFNVGASYIADPPLGASHFPDQHWQVKYSTQCCTFFLERLIREFALPEDREEIYFRVDLTGVGKLFDQSF